MKLLPPIHLLKIKAKILLSTLQNKVIYRFVEGKIIATKPNKYEAISALLKKMIKPYQSFLTIFYNASLADTDELAKIEQYLEKNYDHLELEIIENAHGSAPYIVSLE